MRHRRKGPLYLPMSSAAQSLMDAERVQASAAALKHFGRLEQRQAAATRPTRPKKRQQAAGRRDPVAVPDESVGRAALWHRSFARLGIAHYCLPCAVACGLDPCSLDQRTI